MIRPAMKRPHAHDPCPGGRRPPRPAATACPMPGLFRIDRFVVYRGSGVYRATTRDAMGGGLRWARSVPLTGVAERVRRSTHSDYHSESPHNTIHPSYRDRLPDRDHPFFHLSPLLEHRGPGTHQQKPTQNTDQRRNRTQTNPNRTKGERQAGEYSGGQSKQTRAGSVWERWPICVVQPARAKPASAVFRLTPFLCVTHGFSQPFRARRCSPWLRPGGIHGNLQLPWRYRGCPGGTELPPRYTELYEPVGVDYILFTYLSCTRLHDVLLRCPPPYPGLQPQPSAPTGRRELERSLVELEAAQAVDPTVARASTIAGMRHDIRHGMF